MKYVLGVAVLGLAMTGCTSNPDNAVLQEKVLSSSPAEVQVVHFTAPMDLTIELKSSDNFETAEMADNSGKVYQLKRAVSANGIRLVNDAGVSIHFKSGEGIVEFVKDKPISITEYKK